jgi:hypothetical protein
LAEVGAEDRAKVFLAAEAAAQGNGRDGHVGFRTSFQTLNLTDASNPRFLSSAVVCASKMNVRA